ncbi:hypothetical protein EDC04DRAFT_2657613 [Pisolithus marmoratus]|nr:hypothetical protein EDC04DRAFT_2657613 [Pisolithus marmoratus]
MWDYDQLVDAIYTTVWRPQMRMRLWILGIFGEPCYIIIQRTNDEPFPFSLVYNARHGSPPQARSGINSLRNQQQNQLSERMPSQLSEAVNMVFLAVVVTILTYIRSSCYKTLYRAVGPASATTCSCKPYEPLVRGIPLFEPFWGYTLTNTCLRPSTYGLRVVLCRLHRRWSRVKHLCVRP